MRGDSLPGGSDMDFEARGLPARPKQPQAQPQAQPEYQTPKPEDRTAQSDSQRDDEPAQGGKKEDVSYSSRVPDDRLIGQLINVDIDGVKGDSSTHGRLVDLDARSWERPAHYHDVNHPDSGNISD